MNKHRIKTLFSATLLSLGILSAQTASAKETMLAPATAGCNNTTPNITLTWTAKPNTVNYTIQRKTSWFGLFRTIGTTKATKYVDSSVASGTLYYYRVKYASGFWYNSNTVSIKTPDCSTASAKMIQTLPSMTAPTAEAKIKKSKTIQPKSTTWTPSGTNPTSQTTTASTNTTTPVATTTSTNNTSLLWGAYAGWQESSFKAFETTAGKNMNLVGYFVHWGNENQFPTQLSNYLKSGNKTIVIYWEAMDYNGDVTNQPKFSYDAILRGDWDTYIKSFATQAQAYGGPVILIPFEEANGDWYPWSGTKNGNTPSKHIAAYQYVHKFFSNASNVKFGWTMNNDSVPDVTGNQVSDYYPGASYVDYVGINGFNFDNPWQPVSGVFDTTMKKISAYNKPVFIFSTACAQGAKKAAWITDLGTKMKTYPNFKGFIWFNENKEKDWRINSDTAALNAFKTILP